MIHKNRHWIHQNQLYWPLLRASPLVILGGERSQRETRAGGQSGSAVPLPTQCLSSREKPSLVWEDVATPSKLKGVVNCQNSQKAIVPVGRSRPYSIIILNMRFIPKASLRASSQITVHIYLSDIYELIIQSSLPLPLLGRLFANKLTVLLWGCWNCLTPSLYWQRRRTFSQTLTFIQCWLNVGPASQTLA